MAFTMRSLGRMAVLLFMAMTISKPSLSAQAIKDQHHVELDTALIARGIGVSGTWIPDEGVYKINIPRTDVPVRVDGTPFPPFMGLTTWIGFQQGEDSTMVMGDLVLFQDEVNPVMSVLLDGGMTVTALHNHFFYSEPMVFFMHVGGDGKLDDFVKTIRAVFDRVKAIRAEHPVPAVSFGGAPVTDQSKITPAPVEGILGIKGTVKDGMLKFVIGRSVKMPCGCTAGEDMGINTWAAFMGSNEHAIMDGDFATAQGELQPVLRTLRHSGINIVAIHSHMEGETPRLIYLHFWGMGPAAQLAQGFKSALNEQAVVLHASK